MSKTPFTVLIFCAKILARVPLFLGTARVIFSGQTVQTSQNFKPVPALLHTVISSPHALAIPRAPPKKKNPVDAHAPNTNLLIR